MSTVTDQDLLSPELTEDPFAYYAELRANDPVHWAPASRAWLVTRYADVVAAFGDPRLSSDRVRPLLGVLPAERRAEYGPTLEVISRWRAEPSLVNRAIEEVLRFEGPIKIPIRWVVEDHERDGRPVRATSPGGRTSRPAR